MGPPHLRGGGLRAQSLQLRGELLHAGARGRQLRPGRARALQLAVRRRLLHARATPSHGRP
jgi:hypothetical protein